MSLIELATPGTWSVYDDLSESSSCERQHRKKKAAIHENGVRRQRRKDNYKHVDAYHESLQADFFLVSKTAALRVVSQTGKTLWTDDYNRENFRHGRLAKHGEARIEGCIP